MFRSIVLLVGGLASLSAVSLLAQEAVLTQEYGSGVHAYFTGDYLVAHERLTAAIQGGSKDPRAYYFRGLAYLKLGRAEEAKMDFRKGAELESKDINRFYNVGKALERVQGPERIELEKYRVDARMAALEELEKIRKARYEAVQREEERVLREQAAAAPAGGEVIAPPAAEEPSNPFAAAEEAATPEKKPAAKKGGDENPFDQPEKPAAKIPPKKGGLIDAVGKAIGGAAGAKKKPADEKKPAAEKKSGDDTDPFGPDAGGDKKPAEKKKSPEKATPATPAKPGDKKGDADPFDSPS